MPFSDLPADTVLSVLGIAFKQANQSVVLAQTDYVLNDYSLTYLSCLTRVLAKIQLETPSNNLSLAHQKQLQASLLVLFKQV